MPYTLDSASGIVRGTTYCVSKCCLSPCQVDKVLNQWGDLWKEFNDICPATSQALRDVGDDVLADQVDEIKLRIESSFVDQGNRWANVTKKTGCDLPPGVADANSNLIVQGQAINASYHEARDDLELLELVLDGSEIDPRTASNVFRRVIELFELVSIQ